MSVFSVPARTRRQGSPQSNPFLNSPDRIQNFPFFDRDASSLKFNARVLHEALDETNPLFERMRFSAIFCGNLDEFFMLRFPRRVKDGDHLRCISLAASVNTVLKNAETGITVLVPELCAQLKMKIVHASRMRASDKAFVDSWFDKTIAKNMVSRSFDEPMADSENLSRSIAVRVVEGTQESFRKFSIPKGTPRFVVLPGNDSQKRIINTDFILLRNLQKLCDSKIVETAFFRTTADQNYDSCFEGRASVAAVRTRLAERKAHHISRVEVSTGCSQSLKSALAASYAVQAFCLFEIPAMLMQFSEIEKFLAQFKPANPVKVCETEKRPENSIFESLKKQDMILHHPFQSFSTVISFLNAAAKDPKVISIHQTLYRTDNDSQIIDALILAASNGKKVTAVVELKARFDELKNAAWAEKLQRAGVRVVFGVPALKTHAKCALVVRVENGLRKRYAHLSTGNYNANTARAYTDISHLTADVRLTREVMSLFRLLMGTEVDLSQKSPVDTARFRTMYVAPFGLRTRLLALIYRERRLCRAGNTARIVLKLNSLVDRQIIRALYRASQDGVQVDLIVRGVCTLCPGIPGISENIRVVSVVDKFLEHSRVFFFRNGGNSKVFLSSADLMPRNLNKRIEIAWPVSYPKHKENLIGDLEIYLADNMKSHELQADGSYENPRGNPARARRAQMILRKKYLQR